MKIKRDIQDVEWRQHRKIKWRENEARKKRGKAETSLVVDDKWPRGSVNEVHRQIIRNSILRVQTIKDTQI